ncbi:MAG TPA: DUF3127 domain-containing protein [Saprospiraceae bacterium]|nr:DUF3127 domain-containing protein [Saprospiraceae bacterium]
MSYKVSGVVIKIGDTETKGNFSVRTFAIDTGGEFPQKVQFQVSNLMCNALDKIAVGQYITLHFSLRGKEWNDKIITNLNCYKIEGVEVSGHAPAPSASPQNAVPVATEPAQAAAVSSEDDLPF